MLIGEGRDNEAVINIKSFTKVEGFGLWVAIRLYIRVLINMDSILVRAMIGANIPIKLCARLTKANIAKGRVMFFVDSGYCVNAHVKIKLGNTTKMLLVKNVATEGSPKCMVIASRIELIKFWLFNLLFSNKGVAIKIINFIGINPLRLISEIILPIRQVLGVSMNIAAKFK